MSASKAQVRMMEAWQRGFPLEPRPFARIAEDLAVSEDAVLEMLADMAASGVLSRVGAVVAPNTAGASTLAAMAVPSERLDEVVEIVNAEPGVNHNYERTHRFNLWFVVSGATRGEVAAALKRISETTGLDVLDLPLRTAYHIDLGFSLGDAPAPRPVRGRQCGAEGRPPSPPPDDQALLCAIEDGLPLVPRPYAEIAERAGSSERAVIEALGRMQEAGVIKRLGLVVRHRELGYVANAMVVWDIPDADVDTVGETFAAFDFVTLCYRRDRALPDWPYNLFCMIHGRDQATVLSQIETLKTQVAADTPMAILFSTRRFKQRGARLSAA